jgi:hypothetical protein
LEYCAANRKRRLSALPNVGPYIYGVKISGFTRSSIYIYIIISRLRVNGVDKENFTLLQLQFCGVNDFAVMKQK